MKNMDLSDCISIVKALAWVFETAEQKELDVEVVHGFQYIAEDVAARLMEIDEDMCSLEEKLKEVGA